MLQGLRTLNFRRKIARKRLQAFLPELQDGLFKTGRPVWFVKINLSRALSLALGL